MTDGRSGERKGGRWKGESEGMRDRMRKVVRGGEGRGGKEMV